MIFLFPIVFVFAFGASFGGGFGGRRVSYIPGRRSQPLTPAASAVVARVSLMCLSNITMLNAQRLHATTRLPNQI